jgi:hypothetical protein
MVQLFILMNYLDNLGEEIHLWIHLSNHIYLQINDDNHLLFIQFFVFLVNNKSKLNIKITVNYSLFV